MGTGNSYAPEGMGDVLFERRELKDDEKLFDAQGDSCLNEHHYYSVLPFSMQFWYKKFCDTADRTKEKADWLLYINVGLFGIYTR